MKTFEGKFKKDSKGVFAISLVNQPATEETFIAMSKQEKLVKFAEVNQEQKILMGLVLQPDQLIYRNDGKNEYQMFFSAETIKEYSHNFFKSGFQLNSKLEHETPIEGVTFVESWIVENPKVDKSTNFGMEYPKGSWLVSMKVDNDEIWNDYIKTGELLGFSIDAMVDLEEVNLKTEVSMSKKESSVLDAIKELVLGADVVTETQTVTFGTAKSGDIDFQFDGETMEVGTAVYVVGEDEERIALPDGEYPLEDSEDTLKVDGGMIAEIVKTEKEESNEEPKEEAMPEGEEQLEEVTEEEEDEKLEEETKEEEEEKLEEEEEEKEEPKMMTEDDVKRIVEEMMLGFKSEFTSQIESLQTENIELKSEVVELSNQPAGNTPKSVPTQLSSAERIIKRLQKNK